MNICVEEKVKGKNLKIWAEIKDVTQKKLDNKDNKVDYFEKQKGN